ncbi:MAG TPA: tetratricopeptide repeat protein, partial [Cyclobacteriaceae bacterium]|nr:tetratricopeptide repeat protein [Cyclobacteriaceae bacterium]
MSITRIDQLQKFLEGAPNDSFVKFALALEYINQSDDETGLRFFKEILDHDPDYTGTYYHLGKLY